MRSAAVQRLVLLLLVVGGCRSAEQSTPDAVPQAAPVPAVRIEYKHHGLGVDSVERTWLLERRNGGLEISGKAISETNVQRLLATLADLKRSDGVLSCLSHTDDYPSVRVTVQRAHDEVTFETTSNCKGYAPWNVIVDGELYAQYDGRATAPIAALLRECCDFRLPSRDDGDSREFGLSEGLPDGVKASGQIVAPRRAAILASPQLEKLLGRTHRAQEVGIGCEPARSPDCDEVAFDVEIVSDELDYRFFVDGRLVDLRVDGPLSVDRKRIPPIEQLLRSRLVKGLSWRGTRHVNPLPSASCDADEAFQTLRQRDHRSATDCTLVKVYSQMTSYRDKGPFEVHFYPALDRALVVARDGEAARAAFAAFGNPQATIDHAPGLARGLHPVLDLDGKIVDAGGIALPTDR